MNPDAVGISGQDVPTEQGSPTVVSPTATDGLIHCQKCGYRGRLVNTSLVLRMRSLAWLPGVVFALIPVIGWHWRYIIRAGRATCPNCKTQRNLVKWTGNPSDEAELIRQTVFEQEAKAQHIAETAFLVTILALLALAILFCVVPYI